jgi:hypothetical protein
MRQPKQRVDPFGTLNKRMKTDDIIGIALTDLVSWFSGEGPDEEETLVAPFADSYEGLPDFSDVNWLEVFRLLSHAGAGKLILGRHGHPTRFAWLNSSSHYVATGITNFPKPPASKNRELPSGKPDTGSWLRHMAGDIEVFLPISTTQLDLDKLLTSLVKLKATLPRR